MKKGIGILIPTLFLIITMFSVTPAKASYMYDATLAQSSPLNNGFDNAYRWIHYGNILVTWEYTTEGPDGADGYQYWWAQDRDCDGITSEGLVTVDYGPFGGWVTKDEGTAATNFGFEETPKAQYGGKVIHLSMSWVPGVTVPGEENKFIIKYDGTEAYVGGFQTPLFWDGVTIQGDPSGPYLIMNKFYFVERVDSDGWVNSGFYVEYQYFTIPDE